MRYRHNLKVDHDEGRSLALVRRTSLAVDGRESSIQWRSGNDAATTIECAIPRLTLRVSESLLDLTFRSPQVVAAAADRHIGFVMTHTDERSLERSQLKNSQHECFSRTLFKAKNHFVNNTLHQHVIHGTDTSVAKTSGLSAPAALASSVSICISRRISGETRTATFSNISRRSSPSMATATLSPCVTP